MERSDLKDLPSSPKPLAAPTSPGQAKGKSWASKFRRKSEDQLHEKKKQLQDYTAWVNTYLKRRPGLALVTDLRSDLQDGITLVNLIEIVAHTQLDGVIRFPDSSNSRRHNVDKVMQFLQLEGVAFQGDPVRDILEGNSKGIMRVILALAERYQPRSVRQRSSSDAKRHSTSPHQQREPSNGAAADARDHMTYTLHTDSNILKRSQSPEGRNAKGLFSATAANSFSVPNMASMNVHAGGKVGVARSGSGCKYFGDHRGSTSPTFPPCFALPPATSPGVLPPALPATPTFPPGFALSPVVSAGGLPPALPPKPFQFSPQHKNTDQRTTQYNTSQHSSSGQPQFSSQQNTISGGLLQFSQHTSSGEKPQFSSKQNTISGGLLQFTSTNQHTGSGGKPQFSTTSQHNSSGGPQFSSQLNTSSQLTGVGGGGGGGGLRTSFGGGGGGGGLRTSQLTSVGGGGGGSGLRTSQLISVGGGGGGGGLRTSLYISRPPQTQSPEKDDTYAVPADTLPPNARARVIQPMKKTGATSQGRHHASQITVRSVPEDPRPRAASSPVVLPGGVALECRGVDSLGPSVLNQEMNQVLVGLEEFKEELLRLHVLLIKNSGGCDVDKTATEEDSEDPLAISEDLNITPTANDPPLVTTPTGARSGGATPTGVPPSVTTPTGASSGGATPTGDYLERLSPIGDLGIEDQAKQVISLQQQVTQLQDEFTQVESECVMLRDMLEERSSYITSMKSEIYRKEYRNDTKRVDLQNQILLKDASIKKLEDDLLSSRETIEQREAERNAVSSQLDQTAEAEVCLQQEVESLREEVSQLRESEGVLQGKVASRERRVGHLEEKIVELQEMKIRRDSVSEDMSGIRKRLGQLRSGYSPQDVQQQVIDQLEQQISEMMSSLIERSGSPSGKQSSRRHVSL